MPRFGTEKSPFFLWQYNICYFLRLSGFLYKRTLGKRQEGKARFVNTITHHNLATHRFIYNMYIHIHALLIQNGIRYVDFSWTTAINAVQHNDNGERHRIRN